MVLSPTQNPWLSGQDVLSTSLRPSRVASFLSCPPTQPLQLWVHSQCRLPLLPPYILPSQTFPPPPLILSLFLTFCPQIAVGCMRAECILPPTTNSGRITFLCPITWFSVPTTPKQPPSTECEQSQGPAPQQDCSNCSDCLGICSEFRAVS